MAFLYIGLALCALAAMAQGQNITPTNWTEANQNEKISDSIHLSVSVGENMMDLGPILALTTRAHSGLPPTGISGPVFLLDPSSQLHVTSNDIALISCDPYPGEIQAETVFGVAEKTNVTAIVFYTQQADYCNLTDFTGSFAWIYTTKSQAESVQLLDNVNSPDPNPDGQVYALINTLDSAQSANGSAGGASTSSNHQNQNPLGPSPSTAVAMIILYSITGIITALFLVIIITGAIRAHRHPERYGPRNITGRPRQSRARGLARAIVETLPIVKFGEPQEPKPADVELAADTTTTDRDRTQSAEQQTPPAPEQPPPTQPTQPRASVETGIAAAINADQSTSTANLPENLGCSICTEDFEAGQDQRVLPCDHRFHPECIDPWLLNVSGTCPLCRIDLRPQTAETADSAEVDENGNPIAREEGEARDELAPPLDTITSQPQRIGIRRSLLIGLIGSRGADRMTQEERVQTARQLRRQHLASSQGESSAEAERESSRRARLRRVFGIRTRRTGQGEETAQSQSDEEGERNQGSERR